MEAKHHVIRISVDDHPITALEFLRFMLPASKSLKLSSMLSDSISIEHPIASGF